LSGAEYRDLCEKIANTDAYIDYFSDKLYKKGYQYPNHHDSILEWWAKDKVRFEQRTNHGNKKGNQSSETALARSFDIEDFFQAALSRSLGGSK